MMFQRTLKTFFPEQNLTIPAHRTRVITTGPALRSQHRLDFRLIRAFLKTAKVKAVSVQSDMSSPVLKRSQLENFIFI